MSNGMKKIFAAILFFFAVAVAGRSEGVALSSPGNSVKLVFNLAEGGVPTWSVSYKGRDVLLPGRLGLELLPSARASKGIAETSLMDSFVLEDSRISSFDETWEPVLGETSHIRNNYNELEIRLLQSFCGRRMILRFRAYDYGAAVRYEFPEQKELEFFLIKEEHTQFAMAGDHLAWWIPGDYDSEEFRTQKTRLSEIRARMPEAVDTYWSAHTFSPTGVQTPLQLKTDNGLYLNIHEAACVDYSTMSLELDDSSMVFESRLTPDAEGVKGYLQAPCRTPWRSILVSDKATDMLSCKLTLNLNDPCAYEDVSWIKPVKYIGVWWEMIAGCGAWAYSNLTSVKLGQTDFSALASNGKHSANNANVRRYIDFAADNGFDAVLVEGWNQGWEDWELHTKEDVFDFVSPYPDFDPAALNEYAHSRGVKLMMHHETASSVSNYERRMSEAFDFMDRYGYNAVKTGYCGDIIPRGEHHYGQMMNRHYLYVVQQAAKHHIMVNAHEASRPTGLCRTWPNLLAQESARGMEYECFEKKKGNPVEHTVILPFTRLQGGAMDYTPGIFRTRLDWAGNPMQVHSTIAGQLALYLVMYSPLQMAADLPEHYAMYGDAFRFIKDVALDWDDSVYLEAEPGEYITVARKAKGTDKWFVGGKSAHERVCSLPLSFLDKGRKYRLTLYADAPDADWRTAPDHYVISSRIVRSSDKLKLLRIADGGGFAAAIEPLK